MIDHYRTRAAAQVTVLLAMVMAACSSINPTPSPSSVAASADAESSASAEASATASTRPTPEASPTPLPTLQSLGPADLGEGNWTIISTATNVGQNQIAILALTTSESASFVVTCVGEGRMTLSISESSAVTSAQPFPSPFDLFSATFSCPTMEAGTLIVSGSPDHPVSIAPDVNAEEGVTYQLIVGVPAG